MRLMCAAVLWVTCAQAAGGPAAGPAPVFTKKPTATKVGGAVRIDFAVDRETDVAVVIENARGKVVRHLVAGVLGKNPPAPLAPNALSQAVTWDGKDNSGAPTTGGPFRARVAIGMRPAFDRFLMSNPDSCGFVSAVAVGPGGAVYVFHRDGTANENMGGYKIKIYTREGKHRKALTPFPADIAAEKVKALGVFRTAEGDLVPRVHNWETLSFYPDTIGGRGRDMPDVASSPAVDSRGRVYWLVHGPSLCAVDADAGIPYDTFLGPKLLPKIKGLRLAGEPYEYWRDSPALAVSSDDKYVYFAGLTTRTGPLSCVFRVSAETRGPAEVFLGTLKSADTDSVSPLPYREGAGSRLASAEMADPSLKPVPCGSPRRGEGVLTAPRGLVVAKGLLYVADPQADRIAVFREADRSFVGEIKVKTPQSIGVDPATGAVYVCSYAAKQQDAELIKIAGLESGKELYRIKLPRTAQRPNPGQHRIAVDALAKPVRIWLPELMYARWSLKCIEDAGDRFVDKGDPRGQGLWIAGPRDLSIDRVRGELYIKGNYGKMSAQRYWRLDEKTCAVLKDYDTNRWSVASGMQMVPGSDGSLYTINFGAGLVRFDRNFKPLNFEGRNTNTIPVGGVMNFQQRYLALRPYAPVDEMYVIPPPFYRHILEGKMTWDDAARKIRGKWGRRYTSLNVIGQDGKTKRTVIWQCLDSAVPRVDQWGNIYVADMVKPPDRSYPAFFDGKLPDPPKRRAKGDVFWTSAMYASIIKFPPSGGAIWHGKKGVLSPGCVGTPSAELMAKPTVPFRTHYGGETLLTGELQGALWYRFGYSPFSLPGSGSMCNCEGSGFDVDPFGRVFYPNLGQFRVEVIDTNNNPITTFGKYGNEDSGGKDATVKKPEIPLAWPAYVAASDTHAYVADTVNRRVVRVRLDYAAEAVCAIP